MTKFEPMVDGKKYTIKPKDEYMHYACCDCGMVHDIEFAIDGDILYYTYTQNPRASAQLRRTHFGALHKGVGKWKLVKER